MLWCYSCPATYPGYTTEQDPGIFHALFFPFLFLHLLWFLPWEIFRCIVRKVAKDLNVHNYGMYWWTQLSRKLGTKVWVSFSPTLAQWPLDWHSYVGSKTSLKSTLTSYIVSKLLYIAWFSISSLNVDIVSVNLDVWWDCVSSSYTSALYSLSPHLIPGKTVLSFNWKWGDTTKSVFISSDSNTLDHLISEIMSQVSYLSFSTLTIVASQMRYMSCKAIPESIFWWFGMLM